MSKHRHTLIPAVYIVLRDGEKILLIRRQNTGYCDGMYSLPAGHVEQGESALTASVREAYEEVGVQIQPHDVKFVHVAHYVAQEGGHERVSFWFEAKVWHGVPQNMEPEKCDDVRWFPVDTLPRNIAPEVERMLKSYLLGEQCSFWGFDTPAPK